MRQWPNVALESSNAAERGISIENEESYPLCSRW